MADIVDYQDDQDIEKRDQYRPQMPHRLVFRLCYDKTGSLKKKEHLYSLVPYMEINTGEKTLSRLSGIHRKWYPDSFEDFERNFTFADFQDKQYTPDQLMNIYPWKEKYNQMYKAFRPGFPNDIQFDEEQLIYDFAVEISPDDVCTLLGKIWKEKVTPKTKEQDRIETLEQQVTELTALLKQLLDNR